MRFLYIGDDDSHDVTLSYKGAPFDPTGWNLLFTAKRSNDDTDSQGVFQKATGSGITTVGNVATIHALRADTLGLEVDVLACGIRATHPLLGYSRTVARYRLPLRRDCTRLTDASLPIISEPASAYQTIVLNRHTGNWESIFLGNVDGRLTQQSEVIVPVTTPPPAIVYNRRLDRYETLFIDQDEDGNDYLQSEVFGSELPEYPTASLVLNRVTGQAAKLFIDDYDDDGLDHIQSEILTP